MRRGAFTIIELIFVIFLLGVLSATALVKMGGMSDRAKEVQLKAFAGTLNRTSGAGFWFRSMEDDRNGSVAFVDYDNVIDQYIDLIPGYTTGPSLVNCNVDGNGTFLTYSVNVTYELHCKDGTNKESPHFRLYDATNSLYID